MTPLSLLKRYLRPASNRGVALVYIAILLFALLAIVGLSIDIGYMYVAKTQLQNAADSAAHAGASKLLENEGIISNLNDVKISEAKTEAVSFAFHNKAAKENIVILNSNTNTLSEDNDVTVGFWDGEIYHPATTPVNALEARCRRTEDSPGGKISIFFGKVLGIDKLAASATAVAAIPLRATLYIALCSDFCSGCSSSPCLSPNGRQIETGPTEPYNNKFAWTTLLLNPTSANLLKDLVCKDTPMQNVCNKNIWSTMGGPTDTLRDLESAFYNINLDAANKEFSVIDGQKVVTGWEVIVPVTRDCPPGAQGNYYDPKLVSQYAKLHLTAICASGEASGCWGNPPNLTKACKDGVLPNKNCCSNFSNNVIVIDRIQCITCSDPSVASGTKVVIVK